MSSLTNRELAESIEGKNLGRVKIYGVMLNYVGNACGNWTFRPKTFRPLHLDLDNNCQSPDGYFGNGVCTPTGMM